MQVTRMTDFIYAFRLLNIIQKPWNEQDAYTHGIIDENGNRLRRWRDLRTAEERNSFTYFHRIAFNLKRTLAKVPGFDKRILQVSAAMRLLKEENEKLEKPFTNEEINFIGQALLEDTPTNLTGAAVSTNIDKPLPTKLARRNSDTKEKVSEDMIAESFDPVSALILCMGAIAAIPIAKSIAPHVEAIIDYFKANSKDDAKRKEALAKIATIKGMLHKTSGKEREKLLKLMKRIEDGI